MVNKLQGQLVQDMFRRQLVQPQTRRGRQSKEQPVILKGLPILRHQQTRQQKPLNCKTRLNGEWGHFKFCSTHLNEYSYCTNCLLCCSLFSTSEQSKIGIPTVADSTDSHANPPAIVIYIVDAFLSSSGARNEGGVEDEGSEMEAGSIWLLGLLRCYTEMLQTLPEILRPALVLQVRRYFMQERQQQNLLSLMSSSPLNVSSFRWCPASTFSSQPVGRAICTCNIFAPWPSPVTPNADVCCPSKHTSSPWQALDLYPLSILYLRVQR